MSDARLRELERRFRATGDVESETAWLAARVHAGEVERGQVELAARAGHDAARRVGESLGLELGSLCPVLGNGIHPYWVVLARWVRGTRDYGGQAVARAAFGCADGVLAYLRATPGEVRCLQDGAPIPPAGCGSCEVGPSYTQRSVIRYLASPSDDGLQAVVEQCENLAPELASHMSPSGLLLAARKAIHASLVPWALGYADPVGERLAGADAGGV